jgi:ornithine cyclodeaminase/alanine dehydrogenase-like protein (mu-crystallin family)
MAEEIQSPTTPDKAVVQQRHCSALNELYRSHGVGETTEHKLAFWKSQHPGGCSISHNPTPEAKVAVMETSWLCDQFPNDFEMC